MKRVMELLVYCGALCCVLLLITVDLSLSLFRLMSEWRGAMVNGNGNGMKEGRVDG